MHRKVILHCICQFPFVFTLQRIFRRLQVIILLTPENVKRHTTGQQSPFFNCSLQLRLTVDIGTPYHLARSSTVHCQPELLGTVENTVFAGQWCGVCPMLAQALFTKNLIFLPHFNSSVMIVPTSFISLTLSIFSHKLKVRGELFMFSEIEYHAFCFFS